MGDFSKKLLSVAAVTVALTGFTMTASAETAWQKAHPRRTEVNGRLNNQKHAINQDVKNGTLTKGQAASLRKDDHQIRQEERNMASQNGGHITKSEQKTLNQQENAVRSQIPPK